MVVSENLDGDPLHPAVGELLIGRSAQAALHGRTLNHASAFGVELMLAFGALAVGGALMRFPNTTDPSRTPSKN